MRRLDELDIRVLTMLTGQEIGRRQHCGIPVPEWLRRTATHLSQLGQTGPADQAPSGQVDSGDDLIGATAAAQILGVSARTAVRLAADLDAVQLDPEHAGPWIFRRSVVTDYARARTTREDTP